MSNDNPNRIGNMNGSWAVLLKVSLATYPIILISMISFAAWNVRSIYSLESRIHSVEVVYAEKEYVSMLDKRVLILEEAAKRIQIDATRAANSAERNSEKLDRLSEAISKLKP